MRKWRGWEDVGRETKGPRHSGRVRGVKVNSSWRRWEIKKSGGSYKQIPLLKGALAFTKDMTPTHIFTETIITGTSIFLGPFLFSRPWISFLDRPLSLQGVEPLHLSLSQLRPSPPPIIMPTSSQPQKPQATLQTPALCLLTICSNATQRVVCGLATSAPRGNTPTCSSHAHPRPTKSESLCVCVWRRWGGGWRGPTICAVTCATGDSEALWEALLPSWPSGQIICLLRRRYRRHRFDPWAGKNRWRRKRQPSPVFLSGESHGERSLAGYSPWGRRGLGTTMHASLAHCLCSTPLLPHHLGVPSSVPFMSDSPRLCLSLFFLLSIILSLSDLSHSEADLVMYLFKHRWE